MKTEDPYHLGRFIEAQETAFDIALTELRAGQKRTHWMWYIFPQVAGLGFSSMSVRYSIVSREEAKAYLNHPILGRRLILCAETLLEVNDRTALDIMGSPDDMKLRSSMTLFVEISGGASVFERVLAKYFSGEKDVRTLELLRLGSPRPA